MNERIEELALQAAEYAIELTVKYPELYIPTFTEKFAELIVRECAEVLIFACEVHSQTEQNLLEHGAKRIKEHFGLES